MFKHFAYVIFQGSEQASLYVNVTPCTQNGKSLDEDYFVDDTKELLGKPYHYKVRLKYNDAIAYEKEIGCTTRHFNQSKMSVFENI